MSLIEKNLLKLEKQYTAKAKQENYTFLKFNVESKLINRMADKLLAQKKIPINKIDLNSLNHALFNACSLGLTLYPPLGHTALSIEYSSSGTAYFKLHVTYKGLLHLCFEAGAISTVSSWVIHKNDRVQLSNDITTKPSIEIENLFGDRGPVVGAICTIMVPNGDYLTTHMKIDELNNIASMSGNSGWDSVFVNEFRKKQVLKRALNTVASTYHGRLSSAAQYLSEDDMDLYEETEAITETKPKKDFNHYRQNAAAPVPGTRAEQHFKSPTYLNKTQLLN